MSPGLAAESHSLAVVQWGAARGLIGRDPAHRDASAPRASTNVAIRPSISWLIAPPRTLLTAKGSCSLHDPRAPAIINSVWPSTTPMHQDGQGHLVQDQIRTEDWGRRIWRSSSPSPMGTTCPARSRRSARPTVRRSPASAGSATTCRQLRRAANPLGPEWERYQRARLNDAEAVRREDFEPPYGQFLDPRDLLVPDISPERRG
jgi:hypothetical protein